MQLNELEPAEYQYELWEAFRNRYERPEVYREFYTRDNLDTTLDCFNEAINAVQGQLDTALAREEVDEEWLARAKSAKRSYLTERRRLIRLKSSISREIKRERHENNDNQMIIHLKNLVEELAIRCENAGVDISDLSMGVDRFILLSDWLDIREERR